MGGAAIDAGLLAPLDLGLHIGDQGLVVESLERREQPDGFVARRLVADFEAGLQPFGGIGQRGHLFLLSLGLLPFARLGRRARPCLGIVRIVVRGVVAVLLVVHIALSER